MGDTGKSRRLRMRTRLNVLCLAGALLSLGCCLLPWTLSQAHTDRTGSTEIQLTATEFALQSESADYFHLILGQLHEWPEVVLGAQIFLVGLVLSFLTPIGGIVQLAGIVLFRGSVNGYLGAHASGTVTGASMTTSINFTYYLSIVGALVVIVSLFFQFSPDFQWSTTRLKDRLFVYSRFRPQAPAKD